MASQNCPFQASQIHEGCAGNAGQRRRSPVYPKRPRPITGCAGISIVRGQRPKELTLVAKRIASPCSTPSPWLIGSIIDLKWVIIMHGGTCDNSLHGWGDFYSVLSSASGRRASSNLQGDTSNHKTGETQLPTITSVTYSMGNYPVSNGPK